jgi:hypothetical protein
MNIHVQNLTPTAREAIERRENFRASIAAKAAELADRKTRDAIAAIQIAAIEAPLCREPDVFVVAPDAEADPSGPNWFVVLASDPRPGDYPTIREIQKAVCKHFDISMTDILSPRRMAKIVRPRQIAMYLCKHLTPHSLPQIGRRFGGRDHTTVLHAVRMTPPRARANADLAHDIAILIETITGIQQ